MITMDSNQLTAEVLTILTVSLSPIYDLGMKK